MVQDEPHVTCPQNKSMVVGLGLCRNFSDVHLKIDGINNPLEGISCLASWGRSSENDNGATQASNQWGDV